MNDENGEATGSEATAAHGAVRLVRALYDAADARPMDAERVRACFADGFVDHDAAHGGAYVDGVVETYAALAEGSPDSRHDLVMVLPSGEDRAVVYWRYRGTNTHGLFGIPAAAPPRSFDIAGIEIFTVRDGKLVEMWHVEDIHGLVEALSADG